MQLNYAACHTTILIKEFHLLKNVTQLVVVP